MNKRIFLVIALIMIMILAGCSQDQTVEEMAGENILSSLQFKYDQDVPVEITIGEAITFEIEGKNVNGKVIDHETSWILEDNLGTLSNKKDKMVTFNAKSPGLTTLTAKVGEHTAKLKINVIPDSDKNVYGFVTNGRGGPAVNGATVKTNDKEILTDENGFFQMELPEGSKVDLIVEKEGMSKTRIQDVKPGTKEAINLEVPLRSEFNPEGWSNIPPEISVKYSKNGAEVKFGDYLQETVSLDISFTGDNEIYVFYINFGGKQRSPREGFGVESSETTIDLDTTSYENGETYLRILAYDTNENAVLYNIPVHVSNYPSDPATAPSPISMMWAHSYTFGQNIEMYSQGREKYINKYNIEEKSSTIELPDGKKIDLEAAPADSHLYIDVNWSEVEGAEGYNVYRSFDGINYSKYGTVKVNKFKDYSPKLRAGSTVYYRVKPYNDVGEGDYIERKITPLPSYNVYLESPGNLSKDVSLKPTFTWSYEQSGQFPEETEFFNNLSIFDGTDYIVWAASDVPTRSVECSMELEPGYVYSWDVYQSQAMRFMDQKEDGYSTVYSIAGEYNGADGTGSKNGEFIFTTTTESAASEGSVR